TCITEALGKGPSYNPLRVSGPAALTGVGRGLLLAPTSLPVKTLPEFMKLAADKPDTLNCASSGIGTPPHLGCAMLATYGKVVVQHVPYNGIGPALVDLMAEGGPLPFSPLSPAVVAEPP